MLLHNSLETRLTVAIALIGMVALIVMELSGDPWQLDSHMYFFAALAVLAAYCDWRVVLMAAAAIAVHHLALNFLVPAAIYPGGGDVGRVVLHATIMVLEAAVLVWLTHQLETLFAVSLAATEAAETARHAETAAHVLAATMAAEAKTAKTLARQALSQRFESDVGALVRDVAAAAQGVHANSQSLSGTAMQAAGSTARIVDASRDTAINMQAVATATEELSASVAEIGSQPDRRTPVTLSSLPARYRHITNNSTPGGMVFHAPSRAAYRPRAMVPVYQ